ncbi:MAG: hypothetical protein Fur0022_31970 [Anaerolineales bacterium]
MPSPLAPPFNTLFRDRTEADWAFNLLRQTLTALGVEDAADERFVLTFSEEENALRLNFGKWNVLGFKAGVKEPLVEMALFQGETDVKQIKEAAAYAYRNSDPEVAMHQDIPLETVKKWPGNLRLVFEDTLAFVANRFGNWKRSNFRHAHLPILAEAVFDLEKRTALLSSGLPDAELHFDDEDLSLNSASSHTGYFTPQTFALLDGLRADPTKAFYQGQRDEFRTYLEAPFKRLLEDVAELLPWRMKSVLETQTRVISRILKNDFGRGGAWDHYWGAFYPKGRNRQENAQLMLKVNWEHLEVGFYIGAEGQATRDKFTHHTRQYEETISSWMTDTLPSDIRFGKPGKKAKNTLTEFLNDPARCGYRATLLIPTDEILQIAPHDLSQRIANIFTRLFPFFLLATLDDPLPAIETHLHADTPLPPHTPTPQPLSPTYPLSRVADVTGFDEPTLAGFIRALERRKQAILYGPPGTGKTFLAEHLAQHLTGGSDGITELVQFHPSYAYEDFVIGLRPVTNSPQLPQVSTSSPSSQELLGTLRNPSELSSSPLPLFSFSLTPGRFLDFCARARTRTGLCVLIIDEINRADLSRVFGELMVLLEYRDRDITLASGQAFSIPDNVRIIGTMNTADRSIALVDFALRRRFAFLHLPPNFDVLRHYHAHQQTGFPVESLITLLQRVNTAIEDPNFALGPSFFLRPNLSTELEDIWRTEIEPYLEEYFFDQPEMVEAFRWGKIKRLIHEGHEVH